MNYDEIKVSVLMIAYNHEAFISKAIESVLMQQTKFRVELVIGEDLSNDGTRQICLQYQKKFHERIRVLPREKNMGMMQNFLDALSNCHGKYIAFCDGDDYWTDPLKLQKQVDFLEGNSEFALCFHRVRILKDSFAGEDFYPAREIPKETTFEDLSEYSFIPTLSCVFRNRLFGDFPVELEMSPVPDYPLHLLNAEQGKLRYFENDMAHYRLHDGGVWSSIGDEQRHEKWLTVLSLCRDHFYPKGTRGFERQISNAKVELCFIYFEKKSYKKFREYFAHLVKRPSDLKPRTLLALSVRFVLSYQKNAANLYQKAFKG